MRMRASLTLFLLLLASSARAQSHPDFTGRWQQQTALKAQHVLEVEQKGANLRVKTVVTNSDGTRQLEVSYVIGGPETTYTGLDGDAFRATVHWDANSLIFEIVEREDAREIPQKVTWTLSADGNTLTVDRQSAKSGKPTNSSVTYTRQASSALP